MPPRKHYWCKDCHAKYMRKWRESNPLNELQRKKDAARSYAGVYLRRGYIKKENCEVCNSPESEMHHDDYDKPTEVTWLCREHHLELHRKQDNRLNNLQFKAV